MTNVRIQQGEKLGAAVIPEDVPEPPGRLQCPELVLPEESDTPKVKTFLLTAGFSTRFSLSIVCSLKSQ